MNDSRQDLPGEAVAALERGNKIEAIKHVRVARNTGLKEARDIVEEYLEKMPNLQDRMAAASREAAKSGFGWLAVIAVIALATYYFYTGG